MSERSNVSFSFNVSQTIYEIDHFCPQAMYPQIGYFEQNDFVLIFRSCILVWYRNVFSISAATSVLIPTGCLLLSSAASSNNTHVIPVTFRALFISMANMEIYDGYLQVLCDARH